MLKPKIRFYQNGYYPAFVASLVWNDSSLRIYGAGKHQLTQDEIAAISYVISFNEFEAKLVAHLGSNDVSDIWRIHLVPYLILRRYQLKI